MTDLNKEREAFEANEFVKTIIHKFEWSEEFNSYQIKDCVIKGNVFELIEAEKDQPLLNGAWFGWQEKAKAQAVPETHIIISKDVAKRTIGHIATAMCHPNNTRSEEDVMVDDQEYICRAIKASESGAEG
ncbi:hypothetical protein Q5M47_13265 [Acinetobacter nosocomialis]|nr:hypothetical protein [Acinetobacter nosocomialis]MDO7216365.1 hypothetical protein [Acinetobacter nosocomialis]